MKNWVFDLDNTLFHFSDELNEVLDFYIQRVICSSLSLSKEVFIKTRASLLEKYALSYTPVVFGKEFTGDWEVFAEHVYSNIPINKLPIAPSPHVEVINALPGKKYILTNSPEMLAKRIVSVLPFKHNTFSHIFAYSNAFPYQKPSIEAFSKTDIKSAIYIDDNFANVQAAQRFGWESFILSTEVEKVDDDLKTINFSTFL